MLIRIKKTTHDNSDTRNLLGRSSSSFQLNHDAALYTLIVYASIEEPFFHPHRLVQRFCHRH